jgi:eukaryotic-like serine/threonine-protein kinase
VHRDVKPSNIMLGKDGRVWLTDFGIARLIGDNAHHTRTGMTIGSPAYLAPEQVRGLEVTPAADVYSLALVLLEMLTGHRAYPQAPTEAALARLTTPPAIPEGLPADWRTLLDRMTALEPALRPPAAEVAEQLHALAGGADATTVTAVLVSEAGSTKVLPAPPVPVPSGATVVAPTGPVEAVETAGPVEAVSSSRPAASRRTAIIAALAGVVVIAVIFGLVGLLGGGDAGDELPDGVPPALEQPLGDLHDAVNEGG